MVKKILYTIVILLLGLLSGLFISEIFLHVINFNPSVSEIKVRWTDKDKFIKWAYLDIHEPFFVIKNGEFYIQRQDLWKPRDTIIKYKLKKDQNKKRIFILGESVARDFNENILQEELQKYLDVEVINIGMGSYDSYRIEKISQELKALEPDWVIVCIGNNDGINNYFKTNKIEPTDINYLPYKYTFFKKSKILNILSGYICKEIILKKDNVETNFQNNILKIVNNLKNSNIIFCDLPNNEYYFSADLFATIKARISNNLYYKNLWKNTIDYKALNSRINFIKKLSEENENIYITNLTDILKKYNDNELDYNIFYDCYHFTYPTYKLLSQIINKIIVKKDLNIDRDIPITIEEYQKLLKENRPTVPFSYISQYYSLSYEILNIKYKDDTVKINNEYDYIYNDFVKGNNRTYDNYMAIILFCDVLSENGKVKEAKEMLNTMIKIIPKQYEAYLLLGYIYYKENNFNNADKNFDIVNQLNTEINVSCDFFDSLK